MSGVRTDAHTDAKDRNSEARLSSETECSLINNGDNSIRMRGGESGRWGGKGDEGLRSNDDARHISVTVVVSRACVRACLRV